MGHRAHRAGLCSEPVDAGAMTLMKQLSVLDFLGIFSALAANQQGGHNQYLHSTDEVTEAQREQVAFSIP